jgi:hypothetical protein
LALAVSVISSVTFFGNKRNSQGLLSKHKQEVEVILKALPGSNSLHLAEKIRKCAKVVLIFKKLLF